MTADDGFTGTAAVRHDGWTLERQLGFLEALADTGSVARAAAAVGMSASTAYRLRGRAGGEVFAHGWRAAQAMAYDRLRDIALDRIEHGVPTPSTYKGEVVATKIVFSDRLLIAMLNHLKPAPAAAPAWVDHAVPSAWVDHSAPAAWHDVERPGCRDDAVPAAWRDDAPPPPADPGDEFGAALDALAVAIETGAAPVVPPRRATRRPKTRDELQADIDAAIWIYDEAQAKAAFDAEYAAAYAEAVAEAAADAAADAGSAAHDDVGVTFA